MDTNFPKSKSEAREHIRQIRHQKGLGDNNEHIGPNAYDLEAALRILSNDLYGTTTHFLLELIQNADDNAYDKDVTPTLSITYKPGQIRIDCNERGFSQKNVEAICRISNSTKSHQSKSAGFVGEKGIGFKSVFKVASSVWVCSGHYSFRFDRDGHLGMIAPVWDDDPPDRGGSRHGSTVILKLDKDTDEAAIVDELDNYDPKILLFLRRLRRIEIDVHQLLRKLKITGCVKTVLIRSDGRFDGGAQMVGLRKNGVESHFLAWRHAVQNMPPDERRPGISVSELVLAFPLTVNDEDPVIEAQDVYAFLPVTRSPQLPFILQGDFLLTANRSSVHNESPWNKALVNATPRAFVDAATYMSQLRTRLRYTWISFMPRRTPITQSLFGGIAEGCQRLLSTSKIFESNDGRRMAPKDLIHIPCKFRDSTNKPFADMDGKIMLSDSYPTSDEDLGAVKIAHCDNPMFIHAVVQQLKGGRSHKEFYLGKTEKWHSEFCGTLNLLPKVEFWSACSPDLYIIPLSDGRWARPSDKGIFLPGNLSDKFTTFPQGLDVTMVDEKATRDPRRRHALENAKVPAISNETITSLIINEHSKAGRKSKVPNLSPKDLASHALFLYCTGWERGPTGTKLWMIDDLGSYRKSDEMYLPSNAPGSAMQTLPRGSSKGYGFLHPDYLQSVKPDEHDSWFTWLNDELLVRKYPKIYQPKGLTRRDYKKGKETLHDDFAFLIDNRPTIDCLVVLRNGWPQYQPMLSPKDTTARHSWQKDVANYLSSLKVPCGVFGKHIPLREAFRPTANLPSQYQYNQFAPLLDLPDPNHEHWMEVLDYLRVREAGTPDYFVRTLRVARETGEDAPPEMIYDIMKGLDRSKAQDVLPNDEARSQWSPTTGYESQLPPSLCELFSNPRDPLICIPPSEKGGRRKWVSALSCYWDGEPGLSDLYRLSSLYPEFEILFRYHISIPSITLHHLVDELAKVKHWSTYSTIRIERLLLAIQKRIEEGTETLTEAQTAHLRSELCWPIVSSSINEPFTTWASAEDSNWLIADRGFFREQFDGKLLVLALSPQIVFRLMPLIQAVGLQRRLLSRVASNIINASGEVANHESLTEKYRSRTRFLLRLMPNVEHDRRHFRDKFGRVEVYLASSILQHWVAPCGVRQVVGKTTEGVAFLESDFTGSLRVYMKTGYDAEPFPVELAERLREFFDIPSIHSDLVNLVLTAGEDRIEQVFDERGIAPLMEDITQRCEPDHKDMQYGASVSPYVLESAGKEVGLVSQPAGKLGSSKQGSRFSRLLGHRRFASTMSAGPSDDPMSSLPTYAAAIGKQSAIEHRGIETDVKGLPANLKAHTVDDVNRVLRELELQTKDGIVKARFPEPRGFFERARSYLQKEYDAAELIVCDALCTIISRRHEDIHIPRDNRGIGLSSFTFVDVHGSFGSFLQRLEGSSGRAQGYNRFSYSLDVTVAEKAPSEQWKFPLTQSELERYHKYFLDAKKVEKSNGYPDTRNVPVLVIVAQPRTTPNMIFLTDPWDMYNEGHLKLVASGEGAYAATIDMRPGTGVLRPKGESAAKASGFDTVQVRPHAEPTWAPMPPPEEKKGF